MTPVEFDPSCSAGRFIFEAQRACPPASMSEYEVSNDIIRHLAIEVRIVPFPDVRPVPSIGPGRTQSGHGKATNGRQFHCSMQIPAWQVTPKRPKRRACIPAAPLENHSRVLAPA
jgi:hypothetical protein